MTESKGALSFRRATRADFLGIAALDRAAWRDNRNSAFIPDGEHAWRHWVEDALVFCARDGERIVGAALAFPCLDGRFCLHKAMVYPTYRGQGIATRLMELLLEALDSRRADVFLTVDPLNEAAIHLYERWGFGERRLAPGYYRDEEDRLVLMRRSTSR